MAKRLTDTEKWRKTWFRTLPCAYKMLWNYVCDNCDLIGVWHVDIDLASFMIGETLDSARAAELFEKQIQSLDGGRKWFVLDFVAFQYGKLNPEKNNVHKAVKKAALAAGLWQALARPSEDADQGLPRPRPGHKYKEKAKEKAKALAKAKAPNKVKAVREALPA